MFVSLYGVLKRSIRGNFTHKLVIIISPEYTSDSKTR